MKKISASLFTSIDGVVGEPQTWHFPYYCDELGAAVTEQISQNDTILLGRATYDSFAGARPAREAAGGEDAEMAKALGDVRKIVVSRTPLDFTWRNSEQLRGELIEGVTALKNEPANGGISVNGSVSLIRELLAAKLIDELHLYVHPAAVRTGVRLSTTPTLRFRCACSPAPRSPAARSTWSTARAKVPASAPRSRLPRRSPRSSPDSFQHWPPWRPLLDPAQARAVASRAKAAMMTATRR